MKRLSKMQLTRREEIAAELDAAAGDLSAALTRYNSALQQADDFKHEIYDLADQYAGERSEKWQESDAGRAHSDWKETWEAADFEQIDEPDTDHAETLRTLPADVESS